MYLLLFNLSLLEIIILPAGALILGGAIYFVYTTRRSLRQVLDAYSSAPKPQPGRKRGGRIFAPPVVPAAKHAVPGIKKAAVTWPEPLQYTSAPISTSSVTELKETLHLQQQTLASLMQRVEALQGENESSQAFKNENEDLLERIETLELTLMRKDQELKQARQQETMAQQMAARIDEVYKEFEQLQNKIAALEVQSGRANSLSLELTDVKQAYEQLHKDTLRKQDKIEELIGENRRLRSELNLLEEKLAEANTQRQQLTKRAKYLQDAQLELQNVSESQGKLQKELRRIGELESMLSLMAEERDRSKGLGKK